MAGFFIESSVAQGNNICPGSENYSPCSCYRSNPNAIPLVSCYGIPLDEVYSVFRRTSTAYLEKFVLELLPSDSTEIIPADLLNNHWTGRIEISCKNGSLRADPQAFRSSKNTTENISINNCDLTGLDFGFLSGFDQLSLTYFSGLSNIGAANWNSFPSLPNLNELTIYKSAGLNEWTGFPRLTRGLDRLYIQECDIQDAAMDRVLNWIAQSSADTLHTLEIEVNYLTTVPLVLRVPSFPKLTNLYLGKQKTAIPVIPIDSLHGFSPYFKLQVADTGINKIDEGAFQGNEFYKSQLKNVNFSIHCYFFSFI